ncbi:MAG: aminotransferase class IV, partial [Acidimicrobiales bacterium]
SAAGLGLSLPPAAELRAAVEATIAANDAAGVGRLRITITGGPSPLGSTRGDEPPTVLIIATPAEPWPATTRAVTVPWPRNEQSATAGLKTISYADNVVALAYARQRGAGEAIFPNLAGNLCEGTGTNVFVGIHGRLVTPPLTSGCLAGITRELLLERGVAEEADVPMTALAVADEAFLTSSTREVQPICHIDDRALPGCPGLLTRTATHTFAGLLARDRDP